jgi:hypothetical protein
VIELALAGLVGAWWSFVSWLLDALVGVFAFGSFLGACGFAVWRVVRLAVDAGMSLLFSKSKICRMHNR